MLASARRACSEGLIAVAEESAILVGEEEVDVNDLRSSDRVAPISAERFKGHRREQVL